MTRDDIIRMAREAGFGIDVECVYAHHREGVITEELERFAALVAAAEREACARVCDNRCTLYWHQVDRYPNDADRAAAIASEECADAIRARGGI